MFEIKKVLILLSLCFVIPSSYALTAEQEAKFKAAFEARQAAAAAKTEQRRIESANTEALRRLKHQASPEMVAEKVALARKLFDALIQQGFTETQALTIVGGAL